MSEARVATPLRQPVDHVLMTLGAIVLGIGLWRSRAVSRAASLLIALPLVALLFAPLSPVVVVLPILLGAGLVMTASAVGQRDRLVE